MRLAFNATSLGPCRPWGEGTPFDVAPTRGGSAFCILSAPPAALVVYGRKKAKRYSRLTTIGPNEFNRRHGGFHRNTPQIEPALTAGMTAGGA